MTSKYNIMCTHDMPIRTCTCTYVNCHVLSFRCIYMYVSPIRVHC